MRSISSFPSFSHLPENHPGKHTPQGPHVKGVVVFLQVYQELGTLEVAGGDAHIVFAAWVVEFCQSPIYQPKLALIVVDHDVVRLHIAVHDSITVAVVKGLEEFQDVVADVIVSEGWVKDLKIGVVDVLEDQARGFRHGVADHIKELDYILATTEVLLESC